MAIHQARKSYNTFSNAMQWNIPLFNQLYVNIDKIILSNALIGFIIQAHV